LAERIPRGSTPLRSIAHIGQLQTVQDDHAASLPAAEWFRRLLDDYRHLDGRQRRRTMDTTHDVLTDRPKRSAAVKRRLQIGTLTGALALAAMAPASAQMAPPLAPGYAQFGFGPLGNRAFWDFTGVLTPYGYAPPRSPVVWTTPNQNYVYQYQPPEVIYVPVTVPVTAAQPAVAPAQVATITLRPGVCPAEVHVQPGAVVSWSNAGDTEATLVFPQPGLTGDGGTAATQRWRVRAQGSFSLTFSQPGTYAYYRLEASDQRAYVIVTKS
jgi:plastocyanin